MSDELSHISPDLRNLARPISSFSFDPENVVTHIDADIQETAASLREHGQVEPIVVNARENNRVLNGNSRLKGALSILGWTHLAAVIVDVSPEDADKIATDLNATGRYAGLNEDVLRKRLEAARARGLEVHGLSAERLAELRGRVNGEGQAGDTEAQVDRAAELKEKWGTALGQVWQLGPHRLACGDCTDAAVVEAVMQGERFQLLVTDPPYGVRYEGGRNPVSNVPREKLSGDDDAALYDKFLPVWKEYRDKKGVLYIWFASSVGKPVFNAVTENGFSVRALIIWNKIDPHYGNFMAQYMQKHEPCLYCVKDGSNWYGPTNEITVWDIKQPNVNEFHPTQKPIECMERPIKNSSKVGDLVVDPFSGSGTTIIACHNLGRVARAVEVSPGYVAVTLERFYQHSKIEPELIR